ncbi:MAG: biotin/lipoyl-containing protein [Planctomycetota bacterium]
MKYILDHDGEQHEITVIDNPDGSFRLLLGDRELKADFLQSINPALCSLILDGRSYELLVVENEDVTSVTTHGLGVDLKVESEREHNARMISGDSDAGGPVVIKAAMPGIVVSVSVAVGDTVEKGQSVAVLEAMKMENEVRAPGSGVVTAIAVNAGQTVDGGAVLIEVGVPDES